MTTVDLGLVSGAVAEVDDVDIVGQEAGCLGVVATKRGLPLHLEEDDQSVIIDHCLQDHCLQDQNKIITM